MERGTQPDLLERLDSGLGAMDIPSKRKCTPYGVSGCGLWVIA